MASRYDAAVAELYQAPHGDFVRERKRLADELKASGDKPGATKLGKLPRPTISAWAVNQLWWHARDAFDALFETAGRLRNGDLRATTPYREATAKLRARAAVMLAEAGHAATEATLRKVTTTLAAIAAEGGWEPDAPGTLAADRDPPGFAGAGVAPSDDGEAEAPAPAKPAAPAARDGAAAAQQREAEARRAEAEAAAARRRAEQAAAKRAAEQRQLEDALRTAQHEVDRKTRDLERLRQAVAQAETAVDKAQAIVDELAAKLAELVREGEEAS